LRLGFVVTDSSVGAFVGRLLGLRVGLIDGLDTLLVSTPFLLPFDVHRLFEPHLPEQQNTSEPPALKHNSPAGWQLLTKSDFLLLRLI
jgi:hypothetical protein